MGLFFLLMFFLVAVVEEEEVIELVSRNGGDEVGEEVVEEEKEPPVELVRPGTGDARWSESLEALVVVSEAGPICLSCVSRSHNSRSICLTTGRPSDLAFLALAAA